MIRCYGMLAADYMHYMVMEEVSTLVAISVRVRASRFETVVIRDHFQDISTGMGYNYIYGGSQKKLELYYANHATIHGKSDHAITSYVNW